jgi:hypothetical protein
VSEHQGSPDDAASHLAASGRVWDTLNLGIPEDVAFWLAVPEVVAHVRRLTTGDVWRPHLYQFFRWLSDAPVARALSLGAGAGALERELVRYEIARQVDGVDVSEASLAEAARRAGELGWGERIGYHRCDARSWLAGPCGDYDLVFFNMVLHHVVELEEVLELAAQRLRGRRPGWVYVDEYVGPSRERWSDETLGFAAGLFARVPAEARRSPKMWPPIAMEDPTEMIRSDEIVPLFERTFEVVERRPYYGNVLFPLINAIRADAMARPAIQELVREAIDLENHLIARRLIDPLFVALVGRPKPG